jgi:hypothetical protein
MKIIILLILMIICYLLFCNQIIENANNIGIQILDKYDNFNSGNNCCIISKKLIPDNYMIYEYAISEDCPRNYSNNYRAIFSDELVDNEKLDMSTCNLENKLFGSFRKVVGFECLDFTTKKDCNNFKSMIWSKETCNTPISTSKRTKKKSNIKSEENIISKENIILEEDIKITYPKWTIAINGDSREIKSEINYSD